MADDVGDNSDGVTTAFEDGVIGLQPTQRCREAWSGDVMERLPRLQAAMQQA